MYRIGIIGAGNIGRTLIEVLSRPHIISQTNVIFKVSEIIASVKTSQNMKLDLAPSSEIKIHITMSNLEVVKKSDIIILCVKPLSIPGVCSEIRHSLTNHIVMSMAAGITIEQLGIMLYQDGNTDKLVRCMPNILMSTKNGTMPFFIKSGNKDKLEKITMGLFLGSNVFPVVNESDLDVYTIISGCGPGFIAFFAEMLKNEGVRLGLDSKTVEVVVSQTLIGCGKYIDKHGYSETQEKVASKGGATEAGIQCLKENGYKDIFNNMVDRVKIRISAISSLTEGQIENNNLESLSFSTTTSTILSNQDV